MEGPIRRSAPTGLPGGSGPTSRDRAGFGAARAARVAHGGGGRFRGLVLLVSWAISAACDTRPGSASAWNRPAGEGLAIVDATLDRGAEAFDARGRIAPVRPYRKDEVAGYVEYGVTDRLMVVARPSFDRVSIGAPGPASYTGLGFTSVGGQIQALSVGSAVAAVQGTIGLPGEASRRNPALIGNTAREGEVRLLGGLGIEPCGYAAFIDAQQAFRTRSGGAAAQWHSDLTLGLWPSPKLLVMLRSETVIPIGAGTTWFPSARASKLGIAGVYALTGAVQIEVGLSTTVWGRDALRERGLQTALWYRF